MRTIACSLVGNIFQIKVISAFINVFSSNTEKESSICIREFINISVEKWFLRAMMIEAKKLILEMEISQLPQITDSSAEI